MVMTPVMITMVTVIILTMMMDMPVMFWIESITAIQFIYDLAQHHDIEQIL